MYNGRDRDLTLITGDTSMAITQIGVATLSDELLAYIKAQIKNGTLEWSDLIDTPDYVGQDGKFLKASSGGGSSSMSWQNLPAAGLNWQTESTDFTATDKVGILASNGITITLPSTPSLGTLIAVADHNGEFDADPVTIRASNGLVIEGETDLILDLRNAYVQVVFDGTQWELVQVNHPFNVQEITEESFPGGQTSYNLARVPANRSSLLVSNGGYILPTTAYSVAGNVISFGTAPVGNVFVRHIGIPAAVKVSDTPIGAMLYFPNGEAVDGWLDCTGGSIGRSVYPDLVKYLSKDADAETAFLPDARGNFIRTWDHGAGLDTIGASTIPNILKTNEWGRWLDTTDVSTSSNLWDGSTTSRTTVRFDQGYVGYRFDAPVSASALHITTNDAIGGVHIPTSMQVKASNDGITWDVVSAADSGPFQNRTVTLLTNTADAYRYWAVFGTGGTPYVGNSDYYWGVTSLVFTATTQNRAIGGFQGQAVGTMDMTLNGSSTGVGQVQSGTGAVVPLAGATGTIEGGAETRPNNQSYVLRIKAFHYQSGSLSDSSVTQLRSEVSRLSTQVNDGTSYVSENPPEAPSENARWYDTTSGRTYLWFNDGDSYQWVDDSPQATSSARESINAAEVLATGTTTKRALNDRFADFINLLDNGALRNSASDSKVAFDKSGAGPVFVPHGTYYVSSGDYSGNKYFSYGPVTITGGSTGIVVINLGDVLSADSINWNGSNTVGYGLDDNEGFKEALLTEAGIVDNGLADTAISSQRLDAMKVVSVKETLDKLTDKVQVNGGVWASGQEFNLYNEYMIYNGEAYSPLPATVLPYAIGATPDLGFVYQIELNDAGSISFNGSTVEDQLDSSKIYANTIDEMNNLGASFKVDGKAVSVKGRDFIYNAALSKFIPDGYYQQETISNTNTIDVIMVYGQSNARGYAGNTDGAPLIYTDKVKVWNGTTAVNLTSYTPTQNDGTSTGSAWGSFGNGYAKLTGRKAIIGNCGRGSQTLQNLSKGEANTNYSGMVQWCNDIKAYIVGTGATVGRVMVIFNQGEADSIIDTPTATYKTKLQQLWNDIKVDTSSIYFFIYTVGYYDNSNTVSYKSAQGLAIGQREFADGTFDAFIAFDGAAALGQHKVDSVHFNQRGYNLIGEEISKSVSSVCFASNRGPTVIDVNRAGVMGCDKSQYWNNLGGWFNKDAGGAWVCNPYTGNRAAYGIHSVADMGGYLRVTLTTFVDYILFSECTHLRRVIQTTATNPAKINSQINWTTYQNVDANGRTYVDIYFYTSVTVRVNMNTQSIDTDLVGTWPASMFTASWGTGAVDLSHPAVRCLAVASDYNTSDTADDYSLINCRTHSPTRTIVKAYDRLNPSVRQNSIVSVLFADITVPPANIPANSEFMLKLEAARKRPA